MGCWFDFNFRPSCVLFLVSPSCPSVKLRYQVQCAATAAFQRMLEQFLQNALIYSKFLWTFQVFCYNPQLKNSGKLPTVTLLFVATYYHYTAKKVYRITVIEMHFQNVSEKPLERRTLGWPHLYFSPLNQNHIWDGCFWKMRENLEQRTPQHRCFELSQTEGWVVWIWMGMRETGEKRRVINCVFTTCYSFPLAFQSALYFTRKDTQIGKKHVIFF